MLAFEDSTSRSAARLPPRNPSKRKLAAAYAGPKQWPAKEILVQRKEGAISKASAFCGILRATCEEGTNESSIDGGRRSTLAKNRGVDGSS